MKPEHAHPDRKAPEIFDHAVEILSAEARAGYVESACAGDSALKVRVEALLAHHFEDSFLEKPAAGLAISPITEKPGDKIGRYKLLQAIGEGGCGVVYMAEQEEPVRRRVALKVIKLGMDTRSVIARFEAERQALAMMDHPNIAKVLDAGSTDSGRPYFVMELVHGVRITEYCDENKLPTRERLDLFIKVCQAIQHAHQKGVIHRDIKPSNILVTINDDVPVPKVIDFGIAKATQQRLTEKTLFTEFQAFIGTPAYMSPEQAVMTSLDIDTRSDIYALGVLLYELLTGRTPFDGKELVAAGLDEMRRTIRELEPAPPSTRLGTLAQAELAATARHRSVDAPKLATLLRGDLDWIVMKTLEKDRTRRYETANGLVADIKRHFANEAIVARPPTTGYLLLKAIRRNKLAFAAGGAVFATLLIGVIVATWQAVRANNAAVRAESAEAVARQAEREQNRQRSAAEAAQRNEAASRERAEKGEREARRYAYAAEIHVAFQALAENNVGRAQELLERQRPKSDEEDLRGFEWRYLAKLCAGDEEKVFRDEGSLAAAFSSDGKVFAYGNTKVIVRDAASLDRIAVLAGSVTTLSFSPNSKLLAAAGESDVVIWDTETWRLVRTLPNTLAPALFSPDGQWLLTGGAKEYQRWSTKTWESQSAGAGETYPPARRWKRNSVAFSPDGQFVVLPEPNNPLPNNSAAGAIALRVLRVSTLQEEGRIETARFDAIAFSPDGKSLYAGKSDGELERWDFASRTLAATRKEHVGRVTAVAVAANGERFTTVGSDRCANIWDNRTFELISKLRGHVEEIKCAAISPDGRHVLSGGLEASTRLWTTAPRKPYPMLEGYQLMDVVRNGGVAGVKDNRAIVIWNPANLTRSELILPNVPLVEGLQNTVVVDSDGACVARGRSDGVLELWRLTTGLEDSWQAYDESEGIRAVAFSNDHDTMATASDFGNVKLWSLRTRRLVAEFPSVGTKLNSLAFSADGRMLAACSITYAWVWDALTGNVVVRLTHDEVTATTLSSVSFSPDGTLLATASMSGYAWLWELPSGRKRATLRGHIQSVRRAVFSPDGRTIATQSNDSKIKLWHVATGQELTTLPVSADRFQFAPDGNAVVIGRSDDPRQVIEIWLVPTMDEIERSEVR